MSASIKPLTVDEFLAWERAQPLRYEFDGIQPLAMTSGSRQHSRAQTQLVIALGNRVRPPCEVHGSELKVVTATRVRYPDAAILRGDSGPDSDMIEPVVVFEVLSPSTVLTDRRVEPFDYAQVPSVQACVILDTDAPHATVMRRVTGWAEETYTGLDAEIPLPEADVTLPLAPLHQS
jgi:Uma2 family endonuclease